MFCMACGQKIEDGARFCGGCGRKVTPGRAVDGNEPGGERPGFSSRMFDAIQPSVAFAPDGCAKNNARMPLYTISYGRWHTLCANPSSEFTTTFGHNASNTLFPKPIIVVGLNKSISRCRIWRYDASCCLWAIPAPS